MILNIDAVEALQELCRALFRKKFGREQGPDDPIVFDPHAETPQRMSQEKHRQHLAEMGEAAGLPPHLVYAMRQTGFIVTRAKQKHYAERKNRNVGTSD